MLAGQRVLDLVLRDAATDAARSANQIVELTYDVIHAISCNGGGWTRCERPAGIDQKAITAIREPVPLTRRWYLERYSVARAHGLEPVAAHSFAASSHFRGGCFGVLVIATSIPLVALRLS